MNWKTTATTIPMEYYNICEESLKTKYCAKLTAAGFVDEDGYGIYKKTTTEYKLAAIISYGGGTLALSLSAEPIQ